MKKKKIIILAITIALTLTGIGVYINYINSAMLVSEKLKDIAEKNGLEDVSVRLSYSLIDGWWNATVECSNFDEISNNKKYYITNKLDRVDNVVINGYYSDGATYKVYTYTRGIYKNGEEIDDDYYNSDAYKNKSLYGNEPSTSSDSGYFPNRELDAWVCAQDIVNSKLKAPSTAKFCSYTEATVTYNGGSDYTVEGYVDAENGYGAKIRTNFIVTLTLSEKGYKNGYVTFS